MKTIVANPIRSIPVPKSLRKKGGDVKLIREFTCPGRRVNLGYQPLKARGERNRASVEGVPLEACEYVDDMCAFYKSESCEYVGDTRAFYKSEEESTCIKPNTIARLKLGFGKKLRARIVEWLIEAHKKFDFPTEALYLAINLFDRFMAVHPVDKKKVSLVGVTALQLAVKYAGMRESMPCVGLFSHLALTSSPVKTIWCSVEQILRMEDLILNTLQYDLSIPTPSTFMGKFLKETQSNDKVKYLSFFFIDLCLVQRETFTFRPSELAAAAIYTSHATVKRRKPCSKIYEQLTGCSARRILKCSRMMVTSHQKARSFRRVYKKYYTRRYGWVARAEPAHFLLSKFTRARALIFKLILFLLEEQ